DAARDPAVGFTSRTAAAAMPYVGLRVDAAAIALFEAVSTQEVTLAGNAAGKRVFWRHARRVASAAVRWVTNEVYAGARAFLRARRAAQRALTVGADLTAGAFDTASSAVAGARFSVDACIAAERVARIAREATNPFVASRGAREYGSTLIVAVAAM